jgi:8-oxo-dGTP pyrophosphatase MutT (NUDIX family)
MTSIKFGFPLGGHIELYEDPMQAALREAKEEVGLDIEIFDTRLFKKQLSDAIPLVTPQFLTRNRVSDKHEHVTCIYFATSKTDTLTNEGREQSEGLHWFTAKELVDPEYNIRPDIKFYAQTALEKLGK